VTARQTWCLGILFVLLVVGGRTPGLGHKAEEGERLSVIGPAPAFTLIAQDGHRLALNGLRGKVVVVTFIYTSCTDTCPLLTAEMAALQNDLGPDFGSKVFFVSITVDPERDTPEVLSRYAQAHGANLAGWAFLTGTPEEVRTVARQYGVYVKQHAAGDVAHTFLTSILDQRGTLRAQYVGVRSDPDELLRDLQSLLAEGTGR
jgi:protein SCO1/2